MIRVTLRQLQIFVAVARSSNTTVAARSLSLSQSATSAALNEMESLLGTQLFDRVGKRLVLNDNGRLLMPQALELLESAAGIEQQFSVANPNLTSSIRLGASTTIGNYVLPGLIAGCRKLLRMAENNSPTHMRVDVAKSASIATAVANFEIDAGFIEGHCHEPNLEVIPWLTDELLIVASPNHSTAKLSAENKLDLETLQQVGWILREPGSSTRETVEYELLRYLNHLNIEMEFSDSEAVKRAAVEGLGITCLSRWVVADYLQSGQLVVLNTELPKLYRKFSLILHRQKFLSENLKHFLNHCTAGQMFLPNVQEVSHLSPT